MKSKVCSQCKQDKPLSEFYQNKKTGGYRQPCKNCMKKNRWNKDHRESDQSIHPIPELKTLDELKPVQSLSSIIVNNDVNTANMSKSGNIVADRIVNTTFRVSRNLIKRAKKRAIDEDITLNKLMEIAIIEFLKRK